MTPITRARIAWLAELPARVSLGDAPALLAAAQLVVDLAEEPCRCWPSPQTGNAACPSCRARALVKT